MIQLTKPVRMHAFETEARAMYYCGLLNMRGIAATYTEAQEFIGPRFTIYVEKDDLVRARRSLVPVPSPENSPRDAARINQTTCAVCSKPLTNSFVCLTQEANIKGPARSKAIDAGCFASADLHLTYHALDAAGEEVYRVLEFLPSLRYEADVCLYFCDTVHLRAWFESLVTELERRATVPWGE